MKKFKFKKVQEYKRRGPIFYKSNLIQYRRQYEKCKAEIESRVNGPNTAFAEIKFFHIIYKQGFRLYRHFSGHNCFRQAEKWCNWLLNNYPYGCSK